MPRHVSLKPSSVTAWVTVCLLAGAASAGAAVLVLGNSKAHECFLAAKTGIDMRLGIALCNEALNEGAMTAKDVAATHVNRGVLYDAVGQYPEALDDFNRSIDHNPELGDGYLNRGVALIRLNRFDDALADVQKGIALGVSEPEIGFYDRAVVEEDMGRLTEAYYDYKRALDVAPGYAPAGKALTRFVVTRKPAAAKSTPNGGT